MATEVILPKLGMNMESAKIVRWLKQEGDAIASGDVLAEVETDKTTTDLEAEGAGVLRKVFVEPGQVVAVNQIVAVIGEAGEDISDLLQRATTVRPDGHAHVERVYEEWRAQGTPSAQATPSAQTVGRLDGSPASARGRRLEGGSLPDVAGIRARLGLNGDARRQVRGPRVAAAAPRTKTRIVIYGAGLGAKQLLEITRHLNDVVVAGLIDDNPALAGTQLGGSPVLGGSDTLAELVRHGRVDGVALSFHSEVRRKVHRRLVAELGVRVVPLVDPRAIVGMEVDIGDGALIEAGAIVGPGTVVGEGTIVDVGAVVAHDCFLGAFSHLSPGCTLSGVVNLVENVMVGVGAAINSTVTVGRNVIVAPGAAVMNDVPDDVVISGVPAKIIGQSRRGK
jgi:sugar O-acyltransferase (sialic acid O-acetyltransferase NeuD family)